MPNRTARRVLALLAVTALASAPLASCGQASTRGTPSATATPSLTVEYSPGLTEDIYLPAGSGRVPLVLLVPGGGWRTADPSGLTGLAGALAKAGVAAAPAHIRAAEDGVVYPVPVQDVICALAAATQQVRARGFVPDPVAVLGHSSGAHLAALAVLAPGDHPPRCAAPLVVADALVGLSGPYDIGRVPDVAVALMGVPPEDDPGGWAAANPVKRAGLRPDVPVLLLHGAEDTTVPLDFTTQLAHALQEAGHPTTVEVVPGADHDSVYRADVAPRIARWLHGLH